MHINKMSKNKSRNHKLFNFEKSSSTFIKLMSKYYNPKRKIIKNNRLLIAKALDEKRFELEKQEKDEHYIYKEAKDTSRINQELIDNFGMKAKNQVLNIPKFHTHIKLGKNLFFDPTKENILESSTSLKFFKKGFVKLPLITQQNFKHKKHLLTYCNSNLVKNKINLNKIMNIDYSFDSNKKTNHNSSIIKNLDSSFEPEINLCPSSFRSQKTDRNNLITEIINNKNNKKKKCLSRNNNSYFCNKNNFYNNGSFLERLSLFRKELINKERKQRIYFYKNDYGCKLFKEKYNFLSKKFFSPG